VLLVLGLLNFPTLVGREHGRRSVWNSHPAICTL